MNKAGRRSGGDPGMWDFCGVAISTRAMDVLEALGVTTVAQAAALDRAVLKRLKNCGRKTIAEIERLATAPRASLRLRQRAWRASAKAIRMSREGCDCPNYVDGRRTRSSERCNAKWIRCNGAVRAQREALAILGPEPTS